MAPMVINMAQEDGSVTPSFTNFYLARAQSEVGYIVLGASYVHEDGKGFSYQLGIDRDEVCGGLKKLVEDITPYTQMGIQLSFKSTGKYPASFTLPEIRTYSESFVNAALRAQNCGFKAIELHACHDYWLNFFLSPHFNLRSDQYGGQLKNRMRLLLEIIREIKTRLTTDILIGVRLSLDEFVADGLTIHETLRIGSWLQEAGIDYLSASAGIGETHYRISPTSEVLRGSAIPLARALKESVSIPVIGVGRLDRPAQFKAAVQEGHVDIAAAGRALIADPDYVSKIKQGRDQEITPCISCNFCLSCIQKGQSIRCAVNPYVGKDLLKPDPLSSKRKILVVGGGPAGLTVAKTAAQRGAQVKLWEKEQQCGGALNVAALPPFKEPLTELKDYLISSAVSAGVQLETGKEIDEKQLLTEQYDELIIATGARPIFPAQIAGIENNNVISAEELLLQSEEIPERCLVVGGGLVGLETADFLIARGAHVLLLEMLDTLGQGLAPLRVKLIQDRIIKAGGVIMTKAVLKEIQDGMVQVEIDSYPVTLGPFERIVLAVGYQSLGQNYKQLQTQTRTHIIGDAHQPRSIFEAITEGLECGLAISD